METVIRELTIHDIKSIPPLVKSVFMEFEADNYGDQGVDAFLSFIREENLVKCFKNKTMKFIGCFIKEKTIGKLTTEKLIGIIATRDNNHISLLFVDKNFQQTGIAKSLFSKVLDEVKQNYDYIYVNSSHFAIDIYHKLGFFDIGKEQIKDDILYTPMVYSIKKIVSDVTIRKATIDDIDDLVNLRIEQLVTEGASKRDIKNELKNYYNQAIKDNSLILYVGCSNNQIIATGGIAIYGLVPYFDNPSGKVANIVNMYTMPYYRRQKIASKILQSAINEGKKIGITTFRVSASKYGKFLYIENGFHKKENSYELVCVQ